MSRTRWVDPILEEVTKLDVQPQAAMSQAKPRDTSQDNRETVFLGRVRNAAWKKEGKPSLRE